MEVTKRIKGDIIIYPISFCIDCSETLFELNSEYREKIPNKLVIAKFSNTSYELIDFILKTVYNIGNDSIYTPK